jgi:GNAT superfamily N-acetyltransferase
MLDSGAAASRWFTQIAVAGPFRRRGVATLLMDAAEQLARDRGIATLGITVGLFDEYGPGSAAVRAARLYPWRPRPMPRPAPPQQRHAGDHG